jgi:hypothetical protein
MKGRYPVRADVIDADYVNLPTLVGKVTRITLHGRTDLSDKFKTPAPSYVPPPFGSQGIKIGMSPPPDAGKQRGEGAASTSLGRRRNPSETIGPGPGVHVLRDHSFDGTGKVGVTIKGWHDFGWDEPVSPGPAAYLPRYRAIMPREPIYTLHVRTKLKEAEGTPGYRDLGSTLGRAPKWTMKQRASDEIAVI